MMRVLVGRQSNQEVLPYRFPNIKGNAEVLKLLEIGNIASVSHFRRGPFEGQVRKAYEGPAGEGGGGRRGREGKRREMIRKEREREREATQEENERGTKDAAARGLRARRPNSFSRPSSITESPYVPKTLDMLDTKEALRTSRPAATRHVDCFANRG